MADAQAPMLLPKGKEPTLRVVPMPADANHTGDIFGGWIMSQVDLAGSIPALRAAQGRVATVAVDRKSTRLNSSHSQQSRMPSSA